MLGTGARVPTVGFLGWFGEDAGFFSLEVCNACGHVIWIAHGLDKLQPRPGLERIESRRGASGPYR